MTMKVRCSTNTFVLVTVQIIGYMIILFLRWSHFAPFATCLKLSAWWDFTPTALWAIMVALPAFYAFIHKKRNCWLPILMAAIPVGVVLLMAVGGMGIYAYRSYQIKQERQLRFDNSKKIERVAGVHLPEFRVTSYSEQAYPQDLLPRIECRAVGAFAEISPETFYQGLDSLCVADSSHWRKADDVYAFDSIYGRKRFSKLVLSLVIERGEEIFDIHYDDCVNFKINNYKKRN